MDDNKQLLEAAARAELDRLIAKGLVEIIDGDRYRLTEAGRAYTEARYIHGPKCRSAAAAIGGLMPIPEFRLPAVLPGEQWQPSNGTVGMGFVGEWCTDCARDAEETCDILARSFRGEAIEWRRTDDEGCFCMAYVPAGEVIPPHSCDYTIPLPLDGDPTRKEMANEAR